MATNSVLFSRDNSTTSVYNILSNEIQCYSLPYGGLGFASHVLTYYTIVCLWYGRKPMMPFRPVKYSWFGLAFGVVGLCVSTAMSIVTIVRCRNTWQLLVIAVWKLSMSLLNGITAIHVALLLLKAPQKEQRQQPSRSVRLWILLYIPGMFAGMSELMNLVKHSEGHKGVQEITVGFYIIVGIGLVAFVLGVYQSDRKEDRTDWEEVSVAGLRWAFVTFTTLAVFYSDWVLGMMTTNLVGLPSKDSSVFYWTYFISKRLPMFSW